jgi:hypothetical protein
MEPDRRGSFRAVFLSASGGGRPTAAELLRNWPWAKVRRQIGAGLEDRAVNRGARTWSRGLRRPAARFKDMTTITTAVSSPKVTLRVRALESLLIEKG